MKKVISHLLLGLSFVCTTGFAVAQTYPSQPISLIIPFPPGGGTDLMARAVANQVIAQTNWNIIPINKPGAGGSIGIDTVAKANPDGYTLALGQTSNLAINPTLYKKINYSPERDLTPIGLVGEAPLVIVVPPSAKLKTLPDILAFAQKNPDQLTYGTSGNGTVAHLTTVQLQNKTNVKFTHIPYKGAAQGANDLMGGLIDMYVSSIPTLLGHINNGNMVPIAVTSRNRSNDLPHVPTLHELGIEGFNAVTWFGLVAPANTSPDVIKTLNQAFNKAIQSKEVAEQFKQLGSTPLTSTPEEFGQLISTDIKHWGETVKQSGAQVE